MKIVIYQIFTRLFGNKNLTRKPNGTYTDNGSGKMNDITPAVLQRIKALGVTHVWLTGIIRHASTTDYSHHGIPTQHPAVVKGRAGSPYAITDYYDIDPDIAEDVDRRMDEFEALIARVHRAGLKVIIDFVPNHVARQYKSVCKPKGTVDLGENDDTNMHFCITNDFYYCWGQPLEASVDMKGEADEPYTEMPAKATGNDRFDNHPGLYDWYETVKLNYGIDYCDAGGRSYHFSPIPDVWDKMTDILLFWSAKGVDGFRCDMAEMVPTAFWAWATDKVKYRCHDKIFIAEVYNPSQYRDYVAAGFDYLYDKVGMYDCVRGVICGNRSAADITYQWQATDDIKQHILYFLENHDEQRIGSAFFAGDGQRGVPGLIVSALLGQNPFMLYFGQEFGEPGMDNEGFSGIDGRTSIFDYWTVDTVYRGFFNRRKMRKEERETEKIYTKVLNIAISEKAVGEGEFHDLMYVNRHLQRDVFAFIRKKDEEMLLVAVNFSDTDIKCSVNIPRNAFDCLWIGEGMHEAKDLLSEDKQVFLLKSDNPVEMTIPSQGGRVWKINM